ncbi:hypothetical protein OHT20_07325 [Streptomyces caniferus]|uniref:Uncharacterized protein n=1 Tax=Streptomyces caniferus TaxID=285557 RepID=A0ABZ1VIG5_9ACTN|nr:hypothetical protein [Streptomyces caniferus]
MSVEHDKQLAAEAAAELMEDGMTVGLGTGLPSPVRPRKAGQQRRVDHREERGDVLTGHGWPRHHAGAAVLGGQP